jgi:hypothetical protein
MLIQNLLQDQEVYTTEQNTTPQTEDQRLEEVFINESFIFWAAEHNSNIKEIGQVWVHKVLHKCRK